METPNNFLKEGDVFLLAENMNVRADVPEMFVYSNHPKSTKLTRTTITVGDLLGNDANKKTFKTSKLKGEYVVVETKFDGGSSGHDPYPNGHHVFAQRLDKDGNYDAEGDTIDFYQSGCFNCMVEPDKVTALRTLKKSVTFS